MGSPWGQCGINTGLSWVLRWVTLGSPKGHCGVNMGSSRGHHGVIIVSSWGHREVVEGAAFVIVMTSSGSMVIGEGEALVEDY